MKRKNLIIFIATIMSVVLASNFASSQELKGTLSNIMVYRGEFPAGEMGPSAEGTEINIGDYVVFTAQGRDAKGNPIEITPIWTASKDGIVEITPARGSKVTVKGLKEGSVAVAVEIEGQKKVAQVFGGVHKKAVKLVSVQKTQIAKSQDLR